MFKLHRIPKIARHGFTLSFRLPFNLVWRWAIRLTCLLYCTTATANNDTLDAKSQQPIPAPSHPVQAQPQTVQTRQEHQHSRFGSHGMLLFTDGTALYASHMPLYRPPHDYQLIYQIEFQSSTALIQQMQQHGDLYTLLPVDFDLTLLTHPPAEATAPLTLSARIYQGHFERGGVAMMSAIQVRFSKALWRRALSSSVMVPPRQPNSNQQQAAMDHLVAQWSVLALSGQQQLWVHHISHAPSFDALMQTTGCQLSHPTTRFQLSNAVRQHAPNPANAFSLKNAQDAFAQDKAALQQRFDCRQARLVYLESADFTPEPIKALP